MYPELKENRPHGTDNYPYTQYHMHNIFHAFQIPVHWHDELEVIYTKKGPLNLLIDGKEYTAEDGSVYFVAPEQLHLMGSAAGDVDYYTLLFPLEFISFQSDDSLERELFFPLRNHTLSFPCKLPEDHDTAAKASVLLDQIINANSDRIAANQKNGYQNQLGTRILLLKLVLLMAEQDLLSQPYQKHQQSPERVVILYSAKLLFSHFSARSRRTFPYVRKIYLPVFPGTFPAYALAVYHVPAVIPRKASAGNHKSLHHRDSTAERLSKRKLFYPDI